MRFGWLPICACLVMVQPALADRLTAAEVYSKFQGDWADVPTSKPGEQPCQSGVRRFTLDADGYGIVYQFLRADGAVSGEFRYRLRAMPEAGDNATFLEAFGPEVERREDELKWQQMLSLSMTDADHLDAYFGYAPWDQQRTDGLFEIVPHGYGGDQVRCR